MYLKLCLAGDYLFINHYSKTPSNYGKKQKRALPTRQSDRSSCDVSSNSAARSTVRYSGRGEAVGRTRRDLHRRILCFRPDGSDTLFVTLTYRGVVTDLRRCKRDLDLFYKRLNYKYGHVSHITVYEYQKRGAVHFHALVRGLPTPSVVEQWRSLKVDLEAIWGHGFVKCKKTYGESSLIAAYLSKYLSKESERRRGDRLRKFSSSRDLKRPETRIVSAGSVQGSCIPYVLQNNKVLGLPDIPCFVAVSKSPYAGIITSYIYKLKNHILCNSNQTSQLSLIQSTIMRGSSTPMSLLLTAKTLLPMLRFQRVYQ